VRMKHNDAHSTTITKIVAPTSYHHKTRQRNNNIHTMHATAMRKSTIKLCSTQKQNL
jgi:hypothetical protein